MKIVILDGYVENPGDLSWDELKKYGELKVYDRTPYNEDEIINRLENVDIAITNKTPITKKVIDACESLKCISVLATGYNVVDYNYAKEKGVPVCNVPAYGTASVAQFSIGLLLEICHHIGAHSKSVYDGDWANSIDFSYWNYPLIELDKKTIGIIGFGRIGQAEARIARSLGMRVLALNHHPTKQGEQYGEYVDEETLYKQSDVISLHCNLTDENKEMINKNTIAKMKDGVIIINTARGQLINEQDLADGLNSGKVMAAGVDVVSSEPIKKDNPLLKAKNCFITPHIAWAPKEARQRIMDTTIENIKAFVSGEPINVVNK